RMEDAAVTDYRVSSDRAACADSRHGSDACAAPDRDPRTDFRGRVDECAAIDDSGAVDAGANWRLRIQDGQSLREMRARLRRLDDGLTLGAGVIPRGDQTSGLRSQPGLEKLRGRDEGKLVPAGFVKNGRPGHAPQ